MFDFVVLIPYHVKYVSLKILTSDCFIAQVLLLMATALNLPVSMSSSDRLSPVKVFDNVETELRRRQQCIAEITEMIHVGL